MTQEILKNKHERSILFIICSLYPLLGMGVDLIAPSLPAITHNLQITSVVSKNLITIYLFGLVLGNFFIGFLSDALGRRKIIIASFIAFVIASLLPPLFPNVMALLFSRFLQGAALGAFVVAGRGVLTDVLSVAKIIKTAPILAIMWGIGPIIGPVIGGYLQFYFNWQACFYFFAAYGSLGLIGIFLLVPETHFERQALFTW